MVAILGCHAHLQATNLVWLECFSSVPNKRMAQYVSVHFKRAKAFELADRAEERITLYCLTFTVFLVCTFAAWHSDNSKRAIAFSLPEKSTPLVHVNSLCNLFGREFISGASR